MSRYFFYSYSFSKKIKILIFSFVFISPGFSQTKTNLEVLYSLNDMLVNQICGELAGDINEISLKLNLGENYSLFSNHIRNEFIKKGKNQPSENSELTEINIVLDRAGVTYSKVEKDGWFGGYLVPRTLFIEGNYLNSASEEGLESYRIAVTDTVEVGQIKSLETDSFPFTKGEIPPEPFLESLIVPVIAIAAAAISIILFFSQRSK